ncbi:hypothetical protein ACSVC9_12010 [Clostridium sp. LBM24168]
MAKINKNKIDLDTTLINVSVILKGFGQKLDIYTTATESTEFVDWLNSVYCKLLNVYSGTTEYINRYKCSSI